MARILVLSTVVLLIAVPPSQSQVLSYQANLDGPSESPPNGSPATGIAHVDYNPTAHTMHVNVVFTGLTGTSTASHTHSATTTPGSGTAGVATTTPTFAGFPLGVTSGTYDIVLDMTQASSYNPSYVTANGGTTASAESALASSLAADTAYLNIHSSTFGGGEIRGFLTPVPEPGTMTLCGLAVVTGVGQVVRRARRHRQ
jgi:hypothetical protein